MPFKHTEDIMEDSMQQAIELVKAQSFVRAMNEDEMEAMIRTLSATLKKLNSSDGCTCFSAENIAPEHSIREKTITCMECGKTFRFITRKHLALHGLDADSYRKKWGLKPGTPLACRFVRRERRKTIMHARIWDRQRSSQPVEEG